MLVAVRASSSRSWLTNSTPLSVASSCSSSHCLPGTSRELSGSSSSSSSSGPRRSASRASRFCSPPERLAIGRSRHCVKGRPRAAVVQVSHSTSASYPPASPHAVRAVAKASWAWVVSCSTIRASARARDWAACWIAGGATDSSSSPTVSPVMNWRITPRLPSRVTAPACGASSPVTIRTRVLLPAPLAPIRATRSPAPTRSETSLSSGRPSGSEYPIDARSRWAMRSRYGGCVAGRERFSVAGVERPRELECEEPSGGRGGVQGMEEGLRQEHPVEGVVPGGEGKVVQAGCVPGSERQLDQPSLPGAVRHVAGCLEASEHLLDRDLQDRDGGEVDALGVPEGRPGRRSEARVVDEHPQEGVGVEQDPVHRAGSP